MHEETYRMLGREHEADLEREAEKWRRAANFRAQQRNADPAGNVEPRGKRLRLAGARIRHALMAAAASRGRVKGPARRATRAQLSAAFPSAPPRPSQRKLTGAETVATLLDSSPK
jgi:hypothetical protein